MVAHTALSNTQGLPCYITGLPANDLTTFCNTTLGSCYFYNTTTASYSDHKANCQRMGGYLVSYNTAMEQYLVELALTPINNYYLGIEPIGNISLNGGTFMWLDGTFIGNTTPSNSNPYRHWWVVL
jgi:hypothetical protein